RCPWRRKRLLSVHLSRIDARMVEQAARALPLQPASHMRQPCERRGEGARRVRYFFPPLGAPALGLAPRAPRAFPLPFPLTLADRGAAPSLNSTTSTRTSLSLSFSVARVSGGNHIVSPALKLTS